MPVSFVIEPKVYWILDNKKCMIKHYLIMISDINILKVSRIQIVRNCSIFNSFWNLKPFFNITLKMDKWCSVKHFNLLKTISSNKIYFLFYLIFNEFLFEKLCLFKNSYQVIFLLFIFRKNFNCFNPMIQWIRTIL